MFHFQKFFATLVFSVLPMLLMAQKNDRPDTYDWKKIDSLFNRGLPKSASAEAEKLYQKAQKEGRKAEGLRAQIYLLQATMQEESGDSAAVITAERRAGETGFPQNAIWKSIAASLYQNAYNNNRWQIMQRTRTATEPADFEQWDATRFMERIGGLYRESLSSADALAAIPLEKWEAILVPRARGTRNLRPSLYDLLAYRALDFFSADPIDLPRSADYFVLDDTRLFLPAESFAKTDFRKGDTSALAFTAVRIYQQLLRLHAGDADKDAFLDADLQRLEYLHNNGVMQGKDSLYKAALLNFTRQNEGNPLWALARDRWAEMEWGTEPQTVAGPDKKMPSGRLQKLRAELEDIIARYPESEGGKLAQNRLAQLLLPSVQLTAAAAELPGAPTKVLLTYRNTNRVFIRVAALPAEFLRKEDRNEEKQIKQLLSQKAVQQFAADLPAGNNLEEHKIEVPLEVLPVGAYAAIYSSSSDFKSSDSVLGYAPFQITELAVIVEQDNEGPPAGYVVNRQTGAPANGVTVKSSKQEWQSGGYVWRVLETVQTDAQGQFAFKKGASANAVEAVKGADHFFEQTYLPGERNSTVPTATSSVSLFTDRSIYRPGQTVYFKAIALTKNAAQMDAKVMAGTKLEVLFFDANGTKVGEQQLTTNEWGSVSGSFTSPAGGLTGNMSITADGETSGKKPFGGSVYFSVEEYKRPKFQVEPDSLKGIYALNEEVKVEMQALTYSGVPVDGATVKYRVVRRAKLPYWWRWGGPTSPQVELVQGNAVADEKGRFKIAFLAQPDLSIAEAALPTFTYTVYADVTDQNGETHSAEQSVQAGYRSLELAVSLSQNVAAADLDTLIIRTTNLAGNFLPANVQVQIERLQSPPRFYRKRLWDAPDQHLLSEAEFHKLFPADPYVDEDDYHNWKAAETVYNGTIASTQNGEVALPAVFKKNGWYKFAFKTTDNNGKPVELVQWSHIWAGSSAGEVVLPLALMPQTQSLLPGKEARIEVISAFGKAELLQSTEALADKTKMEWRTLSNNPLLWQKRITEADRGGFSLKYFTVQNNRFYEVAASVAVPRTNKELNISWETHRDKVLPGSKETWTLIVKGKEQDKVAAELAAVLYDASLDAFKPHDWQIESLFPTHYSRLSWNEIGFRSGQALAIRQPNVAYVDVDMREYPQLAGDFDNRGDYYDRPGRGGVMYERAPMAAPVAQARSKSVNTADKLEGELEKMAVRDVVTDLTSPPPPPPPPPADIPLRKNLQETAFFFPQLTTDATGAVRISFQFPEALTEWKLLALAHTKDLASGTLTGTVKTQKELMVVPQLPRFLRQGDTVVVIAKITNATATAQKGTALLAIKDAATELSQSLPFRLQNEEVSFNVDANSSTIVRWNITVPQSRYQPVLVAISARTQTFSDGEQVALPVITNRMLVTETMPLWMNGNGEKTFKWDALIQSAGKPTLAQHAVTVEYTTNPAWYALQALPSLMEYPYDCAEQCFNRYYAAALGSHILAKAPRVKAIFQQWQSLDTTALLSNLEKNPELKTALLEETPWVLQAKTESAQKKAIADLFASAKLSQTLRENAQKLEAMLLPQGAFPWFKGDAPNEYITRYIVAGIGRLQKLGITDPFLKRVADKCLPYLDGEVEREYKELIRQKAGLKEQQVGPGTAHYFYMRSFFGGAPKTTATAYFAGQLEQFWPQLGLFSQGLTALYAQRAGKGALVKAIHQSILERSTYKEEIGRYWPQQQRSWWWYEAPIETQALLIESFAEAGLTDTADEARRWLLKNKQTNSWPTTRATADACYALLLQGTQWLTAEPEIKLQLGNTTISGSEGKTEAGTGYFKRRIEGQNVSPEMGNIRLAVSGAGTSSAGGSLPTWGAVYWQYFQDLDKIEAANSPLSIKKGIWIEESTSKGLELRPLAAGRTLKVGDRVVVRIEIATDRDMEYIHLKDARAAGFEPLNVLSGYRYKDGLGYYESTRDVSSNFFISYLRKGKYVFEYPLFAVQAGAYSAGLATIQCMYAPEFSAHTEGQRVEVKP